MRSPSKKLATFLLAPLLALALAYFSYAFWQQISKAQALQAELDQVQSRVASKEKEVAELRRRLEFYQSPRYLDYVELVAREALGMARPGDTVIVVLPNGHSPR